MKYKKTNFQQIHIIIPLRDIQSRRPTWYGQYVKWKSEVVVFGDLFASRFHICFCFCILTSRSWSSFFGAIFFSIKMLLCKIPKFQVSWGKVTFEVQLLENELKVREFWLVLLCDIRIHFNIKVWACWWSATCIPKVPKKTLKSCFFGNYGMHVRACHRIEMLKTNYGLWFPVVLR